MSGLQQFKSASRACFSGCNFLKTREQVAAVAAAADAAVVGSAFVREIEKGGPGVEERLEALARELKSGLS